MNETASSRLPEIIAIMIGENDSEENSILVKAKNNTRNKVLQQIQYFRDQYNIIPKFFQSEKIVDRAKQNDPSLIIIDLNGMKIGDDGVSKLATALAGNTVVTKLDLWDNNVGDEGCAALATMMRENTHLREIDLRCNEIGDEGAASLASALRENGALRSLDLSLNHICDRGAESLASAMECNTTVTNLNLDWYNLDKPLKRKIEYAVLQNKIQQIASCLRKRYDMHSSEGFVDALVDLSDREDIFEDVLFYLLREMPEVVNPIFIEKQNP